MQGTAAGSPRESDRPAWRPIIRVVEHQVGPSARAPLPRRQLAISGRQCCTDSAVRRVPVGPRRRRGNLRLTAQPLGEFRVGPADVPRQRVTAHRLVDRQIAGRRRGASGPARRFRAGGDGSGRCGLRRGASPGCVPAHAVSARRTSTSAPRMTPILDAGKGCAHDEARLSRAEERETTNWLRRPRCPWVDVSLLPADSRKREPRSPALTQSWPRNLRSTPITRATRRVCSCRCTPRGTNRRKQPCGAKRWRCGSAVRERNRQG